MVSQGQQQPEALHNLGATYEHGRGLPADAAEAARWYEKAARLGVAQAQVALAGLYRQGRGVPRDEVRAHAWLQLAVRNDLPEARKQLAALSLSPDQISQATRLARRWAQAEPAK